MMKFDGRKGKKYHILVNPYPIFPDHLVIAMNRHVDQSIWHRYVDMLDLARKYSGFTFFYNGPKSGASAPDHHHFQAAPSGLMPLECDVDVQSDLSENEGILHYLTSVQEARLYHYDRFTTGVFVLRGETVKSMAKLFYRLLDCADIPEGETEPMFNLFTWWTGQEFRSIVLFRSRHRSHHYFSDGPDHLTMSPGCADMAGVFIVPVENEYEGITPALPPRPGAKTVARPRTKAVLPTPRSPYMAMKVGQDLSPSRSLATAAPTASVSSGERVVRVTGKPFNVSSCIAVLTISWCSCP